MTFRSWQGSSSALEWQAADEPSLAKDLKQFR
jgi:hypothetical protein